MNFFKRVFNSFAWQFGKYLFFVFIILIILLLTGTGVFALESEQWTDGGLSSNITDNVVLSSESDYSFSEYSSNDIRNFVYTQVNQTFYDSTLTEVDFYKQYNYVVYPISSSTLRIYIQDYNILMDYQGLNPIEGADTKFFFWNIYCSIYQANITTHYLNIGVFYNIYIDLNYNTDSFVWSTDGSISDVYREYITSYSTSGFPYSMNFKLYDSYNNNFAWVESFASEWISQFNYNYKWRDIAQFSFGNVPAIYYYGLMDFPTLSNVATPPNDNGGSESGGVDITETNNLIRDLINSGISNINSVLDEMKSIKEIIAGGFRDILDWLNNNGDYSDISSIFEDFQQDEYGLQQFILIPLEFIEALSTEGCVSLSVDLPYVDKTVYLPCMKSIYEQHFGSIYDMYLIISNVVITYWVGIKCYFLVRELVDPTIESIEVFDL